MEAWQDLAVRYMPLAKAMAIRYLRGVAHYTDGDAIQEAYLALVQSAKRFDPARGVDFATFARHRIGGALKDLVHARPPTPSTNQDDVWERDQGPEKIEAGDAAAELLDRLSPRKAAILRMVYCDGLTQQDAAAKLGISKATACRLHAEAISVARSMTGAA